MKISDELCGFVMFLKRMANVAYVFVLFGVTYSRLRAGGFDPASYAEEFCVQVSTEPGIDCSMRSVLQRLFELDWRNGGAAAFGVLGAYVFYIMIGRVVEMLRE